jgi:hypothetical protein
MRTTSGSEPSKHVKHGTLADSLRRPAGGLESEFTLFIDDVLVRPEDVFGSPLGFITAPLVHRRGTSWHLPTGSAVYFDTGVIEVATPTMELERGCFGRLSRSLDEGIRYVRSHLDGWERRTGRRARLQGFSTHYNVSRGGEHPAHHDSVRADRLAWLLVHVLAVPVMLLAANRRSTGIGVRPRRDRVEVTADYTPDLARMAATGSLVAGIVQRAWAWQELSLESLERLGVPLVEGFRPMRHTSRRGWLARFDCFPESPFTCDVDAPRWPTATGRLSLRAIGWRIFTRFRHDIARVADAPSYIVTRAVLSGARPSLLNLPDRPPSYDDVGRTTSKGRSALERLGRSDYERIVLHVVARRPLRLGSEVLQPAGMRGWSRVVFLRVSTGARLILSLDALVPLLEDWER